ncbi:MAG: prepilin-type N-terminal cleavage/methylation domain-containing protein [Luminiphilus sp.]|nr:prepilin-type N-terminal cleavage/methylation domain-containing protein [Luminiphilus sp.]MDG1507170.1 prepilin-type N-terminal cleavage/methylation domain-containing protein [Luminiphilus sp.]
MSKDAKGFTLIELLVTLTIVGILAAVAYPSYQAHVARSTMIEARLVLESWASLQAQARLKTGRFLPLNDLSARAPLSDRLSRLFRVNQQLGADQLTFKLELQLLRSQLGLWSLAVDHWGRLTTSDRGSCCVD